MALRCLGGWSGRGPHPLGSADDQAFILDDSDALALVYDPESYDDRARRAPDRTRSSSICSHSGPLGLRPGSASRSPTTGWSSDRTSIAGGRGDRRAPASTYSGGTTGRPKGIVQRHHTVVDMTQLDLPTSWQLPRGHSVPGEHTPISATRPGALRAADVDDWRRDRVPPQGLLARRSSTTSIEQHRHHADLRRADHDLRRPSISRGPKTADVSAASRPSSTELRRCRQRGSTRHSRCSARSSVQLYGQSEAPATVTALRKEEHSPTDDIWLGSCGRALPGVEVKLLDDADQEVPAGEVGEICVRGASSPTATASCPSPLPRHCATAGCTPATSPARRRRLHLHRRPQEGHDHLRRLQRLPPRGRGRLAEHPDVRVPQSSACRTTSGARPSPRSSCLDRARELDPDELIALVRERKGPDLRAKSVEIADAIPLTPLGKADRKAIRAGYSG